LPPHPLHTLEDGPQYAVLTTATHTTTGGNGNVTLTPRTGALGFVSARPQFFETPAPFIQTMPRHLLTITPLKDQR
jgi:hypothetical protein